MISNNLMIERKLLLLYTLTTCQTKSPISMAEDTEDNRSLT